MIHLKKTTAVIWLFLFVLLGIAATKNETGDFKNLQVLPKDIPGQQLDSLMNVYCKALKVGCDFCHAKPKDFTGLSAGNEEVDFAADNGMKEEARRMIKLTVDINKRHFEQDTLHKAGYQLNVISCNTCHRGNPFPVFE
jgi:hypothetical protein